MLGAYWPMNEGYGNQLVEYVYGNHTTFNNLAYQWTKLTQPKDDIEICEGERVFSEGGYCLTNEKFMRLQSGYDPLSFTIKDTAGKERGYDYELMTHSTIVFWMNIKRLKSIADSPKK